MSKSDPSAYSQPHERAPFNGDLKTGDLPAVWNGKCEQHPGVRPETDSEGRFQDIHWSIGRTGAFQEYMLGTVFSTQLQAAIEEGMGGRVDELAGAADTRDWLGAAIHQHSNRYRTDERVTVAAGEPLAAEYFLDRIESKYEGFYKL